MSSIESSVALKFKGSIKIYSNHKVNKKNKTPLDYALETSSTEIEEILISKGADINAKDSIYHNLIVLFLIKIISNK